MTGFAAIIVAGGKGGRTGLESPKQWEILLGRRVIDWSVDLFQSHPDLLELVVVVDDLTTATSFPSKTKVVCGGGSRTASVRAGIAALTTADSTPVLIHDAARPGVSLSMIDTLVSALTEHDAAAPALPVSDALKSQASGHLSTVPREGLFRVQTPQAFRLSTIRAALETSDSYVDDLEAVEAAGARTTLVPGDARLHKITYAEDFDLLARLLSPALSVPRVGKGFDVHAFEPGDHVTLCGVKIPHTAKLKGHSDADAAWHALTDAILGAAALGDIGDHFPPSDPQWRDADSGIFLKHAQALAEQAGYTLASCDITVVCEAPKVKPHREAMRVRTAELLGLPLDAVSVKATTTERLGFTGRQEGIAAEAVAVLAPKA
ncbi:MULTISPECIES: bifunctional 2-C-methyl-D-erythritol 4-phosphate cytidylyltransferase/2-C-methyl-D-erythritol 2,4-cyclodiphosphate synthase [Hyphomonas]|jgi:2-C-methyl-D-erythritol 4-phosphate cytidylyltransferase/2-C-methyl-D-erythritol 2,4-cyclodiphosphate synthase|uniref:Bifunctional enzyme IspD/IspF n=1 Tax=Hyphomonas adhaerens TaxID=81029 RepID=A0A3B9GTY3_9PROT|nr:MULTISPECIES: bifunctional 2-C-methyl-D-erythritol 4-phosphate cytidylyltransferase/2-C-methyl-D-erythritol 2,4-cyclodiphosphate synthase [Hyphomonas]MBB38707.1 bifunctional 2-C-methyl-D-erythritol 4-phosphate cytidylyltransferase/2-C-methyl-D-erythritol 2,4-cyclodiphosphate synthase [Hyphomonas sp.]HAE25930.1 bifunctional 2-C-methyl-D-erythritol 4-phosphate cytidylyltransferase/2-C-methyl-D-erythritol 2,4-cyclodiphosphate synthase [Hyphomonas adhaerens]|tara:strand:+ start:123 stop:1253 length:1131 start_codon:yes stop_codon:yes gene_type:complete